MQDKEITITLEEWIDREGLRDFVEKELKTHMSVWQVEDPDDLIRLIMISLRQAKKVRNHNERKMSKM